MLIIVDIEKKANTTTYNETHEMKFMKFYLKMCRVMVMVCFLRHKWDGCKCRKCGKIRDSYHSWNGCMCERCYKIRDDGHQVEYKDGFLLCTICGDKTACHEIDTLSTAVGPVLQDGLKIRPQVSYNLETNDLYCIGAEVFADDIKVMTVNEMGRKLLNMANGTFTFDEMAKSLDSKIAIADIHMFFVRLGESGYLKNRVEITLYSDNCSVGGIINET